MHIKARLQLLRNNGQSTGLPNQQHAPQPQDVHPQQYQAAGVGAPPGPNWGIPTGPTSVLHGPAPSQNGSVPDWNRRLAEIPNPQPPAQPASMYDQREPIRAPPSQRPMSPRQESQMRQYQEPHRHTPIRRASPPSNINHNAPLPYSAPQALPQPQPSVSQPTASNRIPNPNYGAPDPGLRLATGSSQIGPGPRAPFGRGDSPPPEIRPIAEARPSSPGLNYPQQHYQHHPNTSQSVGIAAGAPPPAAAFTAAEAAAREREDRPTTGFKRGHESDDEYKMPNKYLTNGESRSRLDDSRYCRPSPPDRKPSPRPRQVSPRGRPQSPYGRPVSPPLRHSRSSSAARREEQRRADENYHPSEAAHHPPTLPSMHQSALNEPPPQTPISDAGRDERREREAYEAAARKVDVDEDYDEDGEEEKRKEGFGGRNSPQQISVNGPPKVETQN